MDVAYIVKGFITKEDIELKRKKVVYAGCSPKSAFSKGKEYSTFCEMEVEIWENGYLVHTHKLYK